MIYLIKVGFKKQTKDLLNWYLLLLR